MTAHSIFRGMKLFPKFSRQKLRLEKITLVFFLLIHVSSSQMRCAELLNKSLDFENLI